MRRLEAVLAAWPCAMATVVVLLVLATGVAPAATEPKHDDGAVVVVSSTIGTTASPSSTAMNVTAICQTTPYPSACETALSSSSSPAPPPGGSSSSSSSSAADPFAASVQYAMARALSARAVARNVSAAHRRRPPPRGAAHRPPPGVQDCAELLDISLDQLGDALAAAGAGGGGGDADGVTTWLSAALTNQVTCGDSLAADPDTAGRDAVRARVSALSQFIATALALHVNKIKGHESSSSSRSSPSGSSPTSTPAATTTAFPSWVTQQDRNLLESSSSSSAGASGGAIVADAVVALDGSGTHRSINEAIAAVTAANGGGGSGGRKVIHVKAGRYEESVSISSKQKNVMLMGDGKGKSVIVGHKSAGEGYTTYASATVGTYVRDALRTRLHYSSSLKHKRLHA